MKDGTRRSNFGLLTMEVRIVLLISLTIHVRGYNPILDSLEFISNRVIRANKFSLISFIKEFSCVEFEL